MIKKKYRALRFVAFLCQVFAWISLVLGIISTIGAIGAGFMGYISVPTLDTLGGSNPISIVSVLAGIGSAIVILVFAVVNFIILLAFAEYLYLQIDTEQNTRVSAEYLRQLLLTQQVVQPAAPAVPATAMVTAPVTRLLPEANADQPTVTTPTAPLTKE